LASKTATKTHILQRNAKTHNNKNAQLHVSTGGHLILTISLTIKKHLHISQTIDQSLTLLTMKARSTPDINTRDQIENKVTAY